MKERIRAIRKESGLTQAEFSKSLGLSEQACKFYEGGYRVPKGSTINLICDKYNIRKEWLLTGKGDMHPNGMPAASPEKQDAVARIIGKIYMDDDGFRTKLIEGIAALSDAQLRSVKDFIQSLVEDRKK